MFGQLAPGAQFLEVLGGLGIGPGDDEEAVAPSVPEVVFLPDIRDPPALAFAFEKVVEGLMVVFSRDEPEVLLADEDHDGKAPSG